MLLRLSNRIAIQLRPERQRHHRFQQCSCERGQLVIDAWRDGGRDHARDQAIALQATQRQRQHALRNAVDRPTQLTEPFRAVAQHRDDQNTPFVADTAEYLAYGGTGVIRQTLVPG